MWVAALLLCGSSVFLGFRPAVGTLLTSFDIYGFSSTTPELFFFLIDQRNVALFGYYSVL